MASEPQNWPEATESAIRSESVLEWSLGRCKRAWHVLEYSGLYLALVAMVKVLIVVFLLSLPLTLAPLIGALVTFAIYANDRLVDLRDDAISNPRRVAFVWRYQRVLYVTAAIAYGLGVALAALGGPLAFGLTVLPGVGWLLYATEWLPVGAVGFKRLKELPVVSSLFVATAWSLPVVILPLAFADAPVTPLAGFVFVYFLLTTFISTEIANVRDVASDRASGTETLATVLGIAQTRRVLDGIGLVTLSLLGYGAYTGYMTTLTAAILSIGVVGLLAVLALVPRVGDRGLLTVAAECSPTPVLVVLVAASVL